jgi:hypothetical protein
VTSVHVKTANKMQRRFAPYFRRWNFEQNGRVYSRTNPDGVISLVTFEIWGTYQEGNFNIELSVFIPEVHRLLNTYEIVGKLRNVDCNIRRRFSNLVRGENGDWWPLTDDPSFIQFFLSEFEKYTLAYLNKFSSREKILKEFANPKEPHLDGSPPRIVSAMILLGQGKKVEAAQLLFEQAALADDHPGHREYVLDLAKRHGLLPKLTTTDFNANRA